MNKPIEHLLKLQPNVFPIRPILALPLVSHKRLKKNFDELDILVERRSINMIIFISSELESFL